MSAALALGSPVFGVELVPRQPLAPGVEGLPRLAGSGEFVERINAALQELDAEDLEAATCYGDYVNPPDRSVDILANGTDFLAFQIFVSPTCEGVMHLWMTREVVNFDLATGERTDLLDLLPDRWRDNRDRDDYLRVLYLNSIVPLIGECVESFAWAIRDDLLSFELSLDEAESTLLILPHGLSEAEKPCLEDAHVPVWRLREMGFDERLIRALGSAP